MYSFIAAREKLMKGIFIAAALFSVLALATITVFLFVNGLPIMFTNSTFWSTEWDIYSGSFGILGMLVASLYLTALSTVVGVVIGLFTAICLYKFTPKKLIAPVSQMVNLLAGIPSVIYGLFGLVVFVPFVRDYISPNGVGYGIFSATLVLSIMILPTVVSMSLDALRAVPTSYFEGALALGATKEQTTFKVLVPAAKSGIFAGVVLAIGRALGETMAVVMVVGNSPEVPNSLFQSVRTLTANVALSATEISDSTVESALIASGVVLFVFALMINVAFSLLKNDKSGDKKKKKAKSAAKQEVVKADATKATEGEAQIKTAEEGAEATQSAAALKETAKAGETDES